MRGRVKGGRMRESRFPAARQDCSESGRAGWLDQKEGAGCMHVREKGLMCPVRVRRDGGRGRSVIHALSRGCTMRASRVMRFVRRWFSVGASFDRPPRRIDEQYRYFVSPSKGENAIAVIRVMPFDMSAIRYSSETILLSR